MESTRQMSDDDSDDVVYTVCRIVEYKCVCVCHECVMAMVVFSVQISSIAYSDLSLLLFIRNRRHIPRLEYLLCHKIFRNDQTVLKQSNHHHKHKLRHKLM
jgi:hypothetical protein